jgi:hypothetical protein
MVISYLVTIHMHISTYLVATNWLTYLHLVTTYVPLLTNNFFSYEFLFVAKVAIIHGKM